MSKDNTFIIITSPETGFLWDQLSQKERIDSLKNIITKKLQTHIEEHTIDILVQTINNLYLKDNQTKTNPINYLYSATKTNNAKMLDKFKKILHETNWIIPILFDRQKIETGQESTLPPDAIYATDLRYTEKKIKEYNLNINSKLLRKLQNPYIAPRTIDAEILKTKVGPITFDKPRKGIWYVHAPGKGKGKVDYSNELATRIIVRDDKVYLDGLVVDYGLKDNYDFLRSLPVLDIIERPLLSKISNERQKIYKTKEDSTILIRKIVDRYNLSVLLEQFNSDHLHNNKKKEVIENLFKLRKEAENKDNAFTPTDLGFNVRQWPYFIVQFNDITELVGNYPLELSKYDSQSAWITWVSNDTRVQHLVYLIEKILTDLDVTNIDQAKKKLQYIKAEYEKKQVISKSYCEKEKCILDNLTYLVEQYTHYHTIVKRNINYKKIKRQMVDQTVQEKLINDILNWGIKHIYGIELFNKISLGDKLTDEQQKKVEQFIINITNRRKAYINNTCPHIPLRKKFDKLKGNDEKMAIFDDLITNYAKDTSPVIIECKLCGYPLACQHEKLMLLELSGIEKDKKEIKEKLETQFYANSYLDYIQNIISCRECGRKIKDISIEVQVDYDRESGTRDRTVRMGHAVYTQSDKLIQSELSKILHYTKLGTLYSESPLKLFSEIKSVVEDDLKNLEEQLKGKGKKTVHDRHRLVYINTVIFGKLMFDSIKKDFKERLINDYLPVKEIVSEIEKTINDMKKAREDIKKYYVYHNQLVEQSIKYFTQLIKLKDKSLFTKLGLDSDKFDKIIHKYLLNYYQKFSDRYKFGLNKTDDGMVKFIRKGKIYQIEDTQYQIPLPRNVPVIDTKKLKLNGTMPLSKLQGYLNYLGHKKWEQFNENTIGAELNSKYINEFGEINTQQFEVRPGIISRVPNETIKQIHNEMWQYSSSKNKRRHIGKRIETVFNIIQPESSATGTLKYVDFNYLLYCPNGRPHLWIMKSSKPDETGRECYWCHMSTTEAKEKTQKMTDSHYKELQNNIQDQKIIEYFRARCTDHTSHNLFNGYCLNCGENYDTIFEPNDTRVKKLKDAWKLKPTTGIVSKQVPENTITTDHELVPGKKFINDIMYNTINKNRVQTFVTTLIKSISQFNGDTVNKFKSEIGKDIYDKLFSKKNVKNHKPLIESLTGVLLDLGYFKRKANDEIEQIKRKFNGPDLTDQINQIKLKFRSEQFSELKSYFETFFQHISIIINNSRSYAVHEVNDIEYLTPFIESDNKKIFTQDQFKIENYYNTLNTLVGVKSKLKSNILHNILLNDLLSKLMETPFASMFVFGFLDKILYSFAQIGDKTVEESEFIDLITEEKVLAKRLKFYKKLQDEKVEAGLAFADFEEQEAYFDAEKDTFQLEAEDAPDNEEDKDIQQEDDIINDIQLDELDVDNEIFDGGVEDDYADKELIMYGNDL